MKGYSMTAGVSSFIFGMVTAKVPALKSQTFRCHELLSDCWSFVVREVVSNMSSPEVPTPIC